MTAEEFMKKLEAELLANKVGVEVWFSRYDYELCKAEGQGFVDWANECLERSL